MEDTRFEAAVREFMAKQAKRREDFEAYCVAMGPDHVAAAKAQGFFADTSAEALQATQAGESY